MKKTNFIVFILTIIMIVIIPLTINASTINPEDFNTDGPSKEDVKEMYKFGGSVAGVIQVLGTIVSVGAMMIIGIRYVVASADEKAEYRERMLPYFIGAVLLFGASNIVNVMYKIFK